MRRLPVYSAVRRSRNPRLALIGSIALATAVAAAPQSAAAPTTGSDAVELRVATYNIAAGRGADGSFDVQRQIDALADLGADLVSLQEVDVHWSDRSDYRDLATEIADGLGMDVFFGEIYRVDPDNPDDPPREFGIAMLSRYPIVDSQNHWVTRLSTQVPDPVPEPAPGFPRITVNVNGAHVHVYGTHLDYRGDPYVREAQIADTLEIMKPQSASPQILLGDFNARPDAPELAPLWDVVNDAWGDDNGAGFTYPADNPDRRIDYVATSEHFDVANIEAADTLASDHLPVVADLVLDDAAEYGPPTVTGADLDFNERTLSEGTAEEAGLVAEHVNAIVPRLEQYLVPGEDRANPSFAGASVIVGSQGVIAESDAVGHALRYESIDDDGQPVELPADEQVAAQPDTIFDVASMTKLFTAVTALSLADEGLLDFDAPVIDYIPEFVTNDERKADVTVAQLLNHTSGMPAWRPIYQEPTYDERIAAVYGEPLQAAPGTDYTYSDLNLITLGKIVEAVSGDSLDDAVAARITGPLGMTDTGFNPPASKLDRIAATEYMPAIDRGMVRGDVHDENAWSLNGVAGHAGIFSTTRDMATFAQMLLNGGAYDGARIISEDAVREIFTNENAGFGASAARGRGFQLDQRFYMDAMSSPVTIGHTGFTGTNIVIDPLSESFSILLTNRVHPTREWGTSSEYRRPVARNLARAVPVKPATGKTSWYAGQSTLDTTTLTAPLRRSAGDDAAVKFRLWYDTTTISQGETTGPDVGRLLARSGDGEWVPVPMELWTDDHRWTTFGEFSGFSGRQWLHVRAELPEGTTDLRWAYQTQADTSLAEPDYQGRGVYVDQIRARDASGGLFNSHKPGDADRLVADGWSPSRN